MDSKRWNHRGPIAGRLRASAVFALVFVASEAIGQTYLEETRDSSDGLRIWNLRSTSETFRMAILVGVGSRDESNDRAGISHFLEHSLFLSTRARTEEQLTAELRDRSGLHNGATTRDYTVYHVSLRASDWQFGVDWLTELIAQPLFDPTEVERERRIVTEEILTKHGHTGGTTFGSLLYGDHPLGRSIGGSEASIADIELEDLQSWYGTHYRAGNMVVAFSGDVPATQCIERIRERLAELPPGKPTRTKQTLDPLVGGRLFGASGRETPGGFLLMGYHGEPEGATNLAALLVAARLLDLAVFDEVRTARGLAYAPEIDTEFHLDTWRLDCHVEVGERPKLPSVLEGLRAAFRKTLAVEARDFDRARERVVAGLLVRDMDSLVRTTALTWLILTDDSPPDLVNAAASLETTDVRDLLARIARPEHEYLISNSVDVIRPSAGLAPILLGLGGVIAGIVWWRRRHPRLPKSRRPRPPKKSGKVISFPAPLAEAVDDVEQSFQEQFRREDEENKT